MPKFGKDDVFRGASVLCWLLACLLATVALNEFLHRSKNPGFLFWSYKKLAACLVISGVATLAFWGSRKLLRPGLPPWLGSSRSPVYVFLALSSVWFLVNLQTPPAVGGDLQYQMVGFRQFISGQTDQFNTQVSPMVDIDLAKDRIEPNIWFPPGPMWLLYPLAKLGLSPDSAARWMLFVSFLLGGAGFLALAGRLGISLPARLGMSLVLVSFTLSRDGLSVVSPTSADCLGMALFPWACLGTLEVLGRLHEKSKVQEFIFPFIGLGLVTGSLYLVKYSWFVVV